jgi:DNA mismatch repair protein MutS2
VPPDLEPIAPRLDLRGFERAPALAAVENFIDRLVLQGSARGEIVHGKGTGVLRRAVQEMLQHHPMVAEFRLGQHNEGGSGVTIVQLR